MLSLCFIFSLAQFMFQVNKHPNAVKQSKRRLYKEQIKKQLLDLLFYNNNIKFIKKYEQLIKTNKNNLIHFAYEQGKIVKKSKEDTKFKNLLEQFKINKSMIIFKINNSY